MFSLYIKTTNYVFPGSRSMFLLGQNPLIEYPIQGTTIAEQTQNIRLMGQYMGGQDGRGELAAHIQELVDDIDKENFPRPSAFIDHMFGSADEFYIEDVLRVGSIAEDFTLLNALAEIGEILAVTV